MSLEEQIKNLISKGECATIEFKESFSDSAAKTLVAFANDYSSFGTGYLLIGVTNDGKVLGLKDKPDTIQQNIMNICRNCEPPIAPAIFVIEYKSTKVLLVKVARSYSRPHRLAGICYIRLGSTTQKATPEEEYRIRETSIFTTFDSVPVPNATTSDLDSSKVVDYFKVSRSEEFVAQENRPVDELMKGLGLSIEQAGIYRPTVAAVLVFGKNPQQFFPMSSVNAIRFRGTSRADNITDRKDITGTLDKIIDGSTDFVKRFSTVGGLITATSIKRVDLTEYPNVALREAISNAVIHRDYTNRGSQIDLYIFDDRIEIVNPGVPSGGVTIEDMQNQTGKHWLRNPQIATLALQLRYIEKAGSGIPRMFKTLRENGSPDPKFLIDNNCTKVIIKAHPDYAARRKFEEGVLAKGRGDLETARKYFKEALDIRPDFAEAQSAWAALEGEIGSLMEARALYKKALESNPNDIQAYLNWANLEEKYGNPTEARWVYSKATEIAQNDYVIFHSWATMERKLGNFPKARDLYKRATELAPDQSITWQAWGQLESKCGEFNQAERLLETGLRYAKDDYSKAWIHADLAFTLEKLNRPINEIERHYQLSLKLNPNSAQTNFFFSNFLRRVGRQKESEDVKRRAFALGWQPRPKYRRRR